MDLTPPEVNQLGRYLDPFLEGAGARRTARPPGKSVLGRGLRRLLDHLATEAILADEERRHGGLPPRIAPRIAALLGRPAATS